MTGRRPHPLLRRHVFYAHRDLSEWLDSYEKGNPCYLYTGTTLCLSLHDSAPCIWQAACMPVRMWTSRTG